MAFVSKMFWVTAAGWRPWERPRIRWRDYNFWLVGTACRTRIARRLLGEGGLVCIACDLDLDKQHKQIYRLMDRS